MSGALKLAKHLRAGDRVMASVTGGRGEPATVTAVERGLQPVKDREIVLVTLQGEDGRSVQRKFNLNHTVRILEGGTP